eukprot:gene5685-8979_t
MAQLSNRFIASVTAASVVLIILFLYIRSQRLALGQKSRTLAEKTQEFDKILSEYEALKREVNQANAELTRLKQHINILEEREGNLRQELSQNQQPPNQEKSQDGQNQKPLVNRSQKYQFKAHWETASQEEWDALQRRRGCKELEHLKLVQLKLVSSHKFFVYKLDRILRGGSISFVGDSITAQVHDAFRLRAVRERYTVSSIPGLPLATTSLQYKRGRADMMDQPFQANLFRLDKAKNILEMIDTVFSGLSSISTSNATANLPRHIVVVNIGLYYADSHEGKADAFQSHAEAFAKALHEFNKSPNHFGFFRDITPQHFKPRDTSIKVRDQGDYFKRDRTANYCSPWVSTQLQSHRNNLNNDVLEMIAHKYQILVQETAPLLALRHDAHM